MEVIMELLGVLFIISLMLNVFLCIDKRRLYNEIKWLNKDKNEFKKEYDKLWDSFYETDCSEDNDIDYEYEAAIDEYDNLILGKQSE